MGSPPRRANIRRAAAFAAPVQSKQEHDMKRVRSSIAILACASMLLPTLPMAAAQAAPIAKTTISTDSGVTLVRGGRGWGAGALIGGIIAGTLIAASVREGRADDR